MRTRFFQFLIAVAAPLLLGPPAPADIRDVGNGGGASEQALLYAWQRLPELLEPVLAVSSCTESETMSFLETLVAHHPLEQKQGGIRFPLDWKHSANNRYVTDPEIGARIEFNVAALYGTQPGETMILGLTDALELLVEALAQHHPHVGWPVVDTAKSCVQDFWRSSVREVGFSAIARPDISLMTINFPTVPFSQSVLIGFGDGYKDVSRAISRNLICDTGSLHAFQLQNLYWDKQSFRASRKEILLAVRGTVQYVCQEGDALLAKADVGTVLQGNIVISFTAKVVGGTPADFLASPIGFRLNAGEGVPTIDISDLH